MPGPPTYEHDIVKKHPPFPAQMILNGHEYVACQARKAGIGFTKEGNCFTNMLTPQAWQRSQIPCLENGL
jgi:hypothetical protein